MAVKTAIIGLGIMGLADLLYHAGVRYGSEEGQEFVAQVMEFVRYHAMLTSSELARDRGPFPAIQGSIYDMDDLRWQPPQPLHCSRLATNEPSRSTNPSAPKSSGASSEPTPSRRSRSIR